MALASLVVALEWAPVFIPAPAAALGGMPSKASASAPSAAGTPARGLAAGFCPAPEVLESTVAFAIFVAGRERR